MIDVSCFTQNNPQRSEVNILCTSHWFSYNSGLWMAKVTDSVIEAGYLAFYPFVCRTIVISIEKYCIHDAPTLHHPINMIKLRRKEPHPHGLTLFQPKVVTLPNHSRSSIDVVVKLLACGARDTGFDSRSRRYDFRDWLSKASKSWYDWKIAKARSLKRRKILYTTATT